MACSFLNYNYRPIILQTEIYIDKIYALPETNSKEIKVKNLKSSHVSKN